MNDCNYNDSLVAACLSDVCVRATACWGWLVVGVAWGAVGAGGSALVHGRCKSLVDISSVASVCE